MVLKIEKNSKTVGAFIPETMRKNQSNSVVLDKSVRTVNGDWLLKCKTGSQCLSLNPLSLDVKDVKVRIVKQKLTFCNH